jgi:hypothetical protein
MTRRKRPESAFLNTLYRPLLDDCLREVQEALKVAYALEHDLPPAEIAERLQLSLGEVKDASKRVARARERLEPGRAGDPPLGRRAGIGPVLEARTPRFAGQKATPPRGFEPRFPP